MDQIDISLSLLLAKNSRMPLRTLAERLDLSPSAVHKRIQDLMQSGIIQKCFTGLTFKALPGFIVTINGRSTSTSLYETMQEIGKNMYVYKVVIAAGNYVYIHGVLPDISKLDSFTNTIKDIAQLSQPEILLIPTQVTIKKDDCAKLSILDYKIIYSLMDDSRKLHTKIAEELSISTKTVQRRLTYLEENDLISFGIHWIPTASSDILSFFHLELKDSLKRDEILSILLKEYRPSVLGVNKISNHPNLLLLNVWTKTMKDIKMFHQNLEGTGWFSQIYSNIFYDLMMFDTWRKSFVENQIKH